MAGDYLQISFVTNAQTASGAGIFSYVQVLNPGWSSSGGVGPPGPPGPTGPAGPTGSSPVTYRTNAWSLMGVAVQTNPPAGGVQYSQWVAGSPGYWAWVRIP